MPRRLLSIERRLAVLPTVAPEKRTALPLVVQSEVVPMLCSSREVLGVG
jgi:hypothetical protein